MSWTSPTWAWTASTRPAAAGWPPTDRAPFPRPCTSHGPAGPGRLTLSDASAPQATGGRPGWRQCRAIAVPAHPLDIAGQARSVRPTAPGLHPKGPCVMSDLTTPFWPRPHRRARGWGCWRKRPASRCRPPDSPSGRTASRRPASGMHAGPSYWKLETTSSAHLPDRCGRRMTASRATSVPATPPYSRAGGPGLAGPREDPQGLRHLLNRPSR